MDTWELFSKGIAPAMAHPKVRERRRGPMGGMLAQWGADGPLSPAWICKGLWACPGTSKSGPAAGRELKPCVYKRSCCYMGADVRFSPGCLKWKFLRLWVLFLKAGGVRLEWCNCRAAQGSGAQRVFQNSTIAYPLWFESLLPISPKRVPGKWHSSKCAARSEMLAGWCCEVSGETLFLEAVVLENSSLAQVLDLSSCLSLGWVTNFWVGRTIWT